MSYGRVEHRQTIDLVHLTDCWCSTISNVTLEARTADVIAPA
jgi:hypothetical protein